MTYSKKLSAAVLCAAMLSCRLAAAQPKTIKFATLAPEGSTWMKVMTELNEELSSKTSGQVKFKFYPGGVSGDEKDVVKKIRIGQLQGGGFTGVGLGEIAPEVRVLDAPWLFRDDREVDFIHKRLDERFASALDKAGYIVLGWVDIGWVYVFSKNPIEKPEDMKAQKMWVWEGDQIAQSAYKAIGVSPIPLSIVDVMSSLQTGLVNAVYGPPMGVVALQWFTRTKYIYAAPVADSTGAVLVSKKSFDELPPEQRKTLLEVSAKHLKRLNEYSRRENKEALAELTKQGLVISAKPSQESSKHLEELGKTARHELVGKLFSQDILDKVEKSLAELRSSAVSGSGTNAKDGGKAKKS